MLGAKIYQVQNSICRQRSGSLDDGDQCLLRRPGRRRKPATKEAWRRFGALTRCSANDAIDIKLDTRINLPPEILAHSRVAVDSGVFTVRFWCVQARNGAISWPRRLMRVSSYLRSWGTTPATDRRMSPSPCFRGTRSAAWWYCCSRFLRSEVEASQLQLARCRPGGQPVERSQLRHHLFFPATV